MVRSPREHSPITDASPEGLEIVSFPNSLRNDGRALTYMGADGSLVLVPSQGQRHDFHLSELLHRAGLSTATVAQLGDQQGLRYPADADIVTLPDILNAAVQSPDALRDVTNAFNMLGWTLYEMQRRFHVTPHIRDINDVAFDRTANRAEILAPFDASHESAEIMFKELLGNVRSHVQRQEEYPILQAAALAHFGPHEGYSV